MKIIDITVEKNHSLIVSINKEDKIVTPGIRVLDSATQKTYDVSFADFSNDIYKISDMCDKAKKELFNYMSQESIYKALIDIWNLEYDDEEEPYRYDFLAYMRNKEDIEITEYHIDKIEKDVVEAHKQVEENQNKNVTSTANNMIFNGKFLAGDKVIDIFLDFDSFETLKVPNLCIIPKNNPDVYVLIHAYKPEYLTIERLNVEEKKSLLTLLTQNVYDVAFAYWRAYILDKKCNENFITYDKFIKKKLKVLFPKLPKYKKLSVLK